MSDISQKRTLKKNAIGFTEVLFQGIAAVAPAGAAVATMTGAAAFALGSLPLSAFLAFLVVFLNALVLSRISKRVAGAGGYYLYVKNGYGKRVATFVGVLYAFYQVMAISLVALSVSVFLPAILSSVFGLTVPSYAWLPLLLVSLAFGFTVSYLGIRESTRYSSVMAAIEMLTVVALGALLLIKSGHLTLSVFTPSYAQGGFAGVGLGVLFMYTAFAGFGNSTPLGEEATDAHSHISRALLLTALVLGAFFIFAAYAFTVAWGPSQMSSYASALVPGVTLVYERVSPYAAAFLTALFINSLLTGLVVLTNSTSRVMFDMSRDGILPGALSSVHRSRQTPHVSAFLVTLSSVFVSAVSTLLLGGFNAFLFCATAATLGTLLVHSVVNASMPAVLRKSQARQGIADFMLVAATIVVLALVFYSTLLSINAAVLAGAVVFAAFTAASAAFALTRR